MEGNASKRGGVGSSGGKGTGRPAINEMGATIIRGLVKKPVEGYCVRIVIEKDGEVREHQLRVKLKQTDRRPWPQFDAMLHNLHLNHSPAFLRWATDPIKEKFSTKNWMGICCAPLTPNNVLISIVIKEPNCFQRLCIKTSNKLTT